MADKKDTVWLTPEGGLPTGYWPTKAGLVEFTRSDLAASAIEAARAEERAKYAALVDAATEQLNYMDLCNHRGDLERNLRAALAAIRKGDAHD